MSRSALTHRAVRLLNLLTAMFLVLALTPLSTPANASDSKRSLYQDGGPFEESKLFAEESQLDLPGQDSGRATVGDVSHVARVFYSDLHGRALSQIFSNPPIRLVDYGSYAWIEMDHVQYEELVRSVVHFEEEPEFGKVQVGGYYFDPVNEELPSSATANRSLATTAEGYGFNLIQLRGPVTDDQMSHLQTTASVIQYLPHHTYIVWSSSGGFFQALQIDGVRWGGPYFSDFRITSRVLKELENGMRSHLSLDVSILDDGKLAQIGERIQALGGFAEGQDTIKVMDDSFVLKLWRVYLPAKSVESLSNIPEVLNIDLASTPRVEDERSAQIIADNAPGGNPEPGYLNWLNGIGVHGNGVRVAIVDTGVDWDHPELSVASGTEYGGYSEEGQPGSDGAPYSGSGHGTHVAGIVAGNGSTGAADNHPLDQSFLYGMGVAPDATLHAIDFLSGAYTENFDSSNGGFSVTGNGSWEWGQPSGIPWNYFDKVWGTNLANNYGNNENGTLTSPVIDLLGYAQSPVAGPVNVSLNWLAWKALASEDCIRLEFSRDGGTSWLDAGYTVCGPIQVDEWRIEGVQLSPDDLVPGFRFRFAFQTNGSGTDLGYYIDGFDIKAVASLQHVLEQVSTHADLSNNSWGSGPGGYSTISNQLDGYSLENSSLAVFSAGNCGSPNPPGWQRCNFVTNCAQGPCINSISHEGEAKNVLVVGSSNSERSSVNLIGIPNGNINAISGFSSRGPVGTRILPHVIAPGDVIMSTENRIVDPGGRIDLSCLDSPSNSDLHAKCSGTSMAAPHVAGAAALFVEYWSQIHLSSVRPSPAMVKAALIGTTDDMATMPGAEDGFGNPLGYRPNNHQGWGRVNLDRLLNPSVSVQYYDHPRLLTESGDVWQTLVAVDDPGEPLRITLTWLDPPANASGYFLVNDLDLRLTGPDGTIWRANAANFAQGWSTAGGNHDRINNVENIWILQPQAGVYTLSVIGTAINGDGDYSNSDPTDQSFSLVCYNCGTVISPNSVDVSLIIDSSGSMSSNDPSGMRKEGAKVFVDTAQNGDGIAVVSFANSAVVRWPMTPLTSDRTAVKAAIDQIGASGQTNIGGGLQSGYNQLQAGNADHLKAAVLMTDGQHNTGTNPSTVVPLYVDAGWPIYTIGLGSGVNQQFLQQVADETGGTYTQLSDPDDLIRVYFEIVGAILGGTTVFNQQYPMQQGETIQATVGVPANQSQVTFLVSWPGSRIDTTLTTPSGQQITPQTVDPNVYHAQGLTYELYRITNPESGDWIVSMYGADLPPGGEMVELTVNAIGQTAVAPTANAGGPYTGLVGQPVLFDGSASFDPDGSITLYEWDFDSDGTFDYSSSDPTATHTYGAPYNGTVILQVTDNSGTTATGAASVTIEAVLVCNSAPEGFDAGARAAGWTVLTGVAGGPEWTDLSACGQYANWTNGSGDAACVSAGNIIVQPFDTELRTPVFSLAGYVEAYLNYQANYHNWASQDQLDLDISSDGGVTWTTLRSWQEDHGAPFGLPGENVNVNLASYLGQSNLMARWRYYTPSGQGLSYYAQLDEVRLSCTEIPPTAVTVSEMTSATSQSPLPATSLPLTGLPAAAGLAFCAVAWLRRKR